MTELKIPSINDAEAILSEASFLNPGPWVAHSRNVALAAQMIAMEHPEMDEQAAYIMGCLHDIGRRFGVTGMRHVLDGYNFLFASGYLDAARISLTHSYPIKVAASGFGGWDGSLEEFQFVQAYLDRAKYDLYDRLIQLCDSLSLPTGFSLMEKRLVDVVRRYGFNDYALPKWEAYFAIKAEFDRAIGKSVYTLLPGIFKNTFEVDLPSLINGL